ncbi:MAG TPA: hypothetical protein VGH89_01325 [Pseudonocardia sp.]|jgi:hypothetical protein
MAKYGGRAVIAATAVAFGSLAMAGTALADSTVGTGGNAGSGGAANANCAIPIGVSAGVIGQGGPVSQCNASGGGGGNGGGGVKY